MDAFPAVGPFIAALSCVDSPTPSKACGHSAALASNLERLHVSVSLAGHLFPQNLQELNYH